MKTALIIARLVIAIILGWPLTYAPVLITAQFGLHSWGYAHLGIPLILYPFTIWLVYVLFGFFPVFKKQLGNEAKQNEMPQA
jgi:hypothetical protein